MGDAGGGLESLDRKSSPPPPDPAWFGDDCLSAAEGAAELVVNSIHPTRDSEEMRRDVIDHIQQLLKDRLDCEVFPYGSVPLKTYLPDGDIDLTVLKDPNVEESLARDVLAALKEEELNENSKYRVKDTQFVNAEVKIVKCLVGNFVIDISFNQLGGLSTLCFLEQIDRIVGRKHLFKRSIILVKAWCYHESRILGAHHGLISTYALETLVLYIFHLFQSSLGGPVSVFYRFLEYYSRFDWDTYCISLKGPVYKSSLPDTVVEMPESGWADLMLSEEFLENCMEMFSVPSKGLEEKPKVFPAKHLNIIDPLKESNNLGRSVGKGNFYRIRSAFKYGAHKFGHILLQPRHKVAGEVSDFFANTLARHGHQRKSISIQHSTLKFGDEDVEEKSPSVFRDELGIDIREPEAFNLLSNLSGDYDSYIRNLLDGQLCHGFTKSAPEVSEHPSLDTMIQYKVRNIVIQKQISQMNPRTVSMEQNAHSNAKQKARGTSTYFPQPNEFHKERRSSERRNNYIAPGYLNESMENVTQ